ncbi:peptidase domain-containing ABC transporter [Chryseobacterium fistulae]|uniref:Lactococcin-G-processing and transport ATP-binding protein LagD n=1 Tax=Chryseobacterium fistulae TaxID=2675058 RepID=A0A6N4XML9_9FLAO|nr:peptidase domain-containing ABC transporter [Chryseobacterium fistulae]CAA7387124.1 Lactococcin-G-processing and transport ATP-binding protein LagD [Chryseobacterium fistulae]
MKINKLIQKTFALQNDLTDCGVGCLQSLIRYYGGDISLETLREKSGTSKTGTTLLGLFQCAKAIGFGADGCEADIDALIIHGEPVILHVIIDQKFEHYVICYSYNSLGNHQFLIGDPAKGLEYWTKEYLEEVWQSKTCLTLKPNSEFQKKVQTNSEKRKWLKNLIKEDQEAVYIIIFLGVIFSLLGMSMSIFSQKLIDDILPKKKISLLILSISFLGFLLFARVIIQTLREFYIIKQAKAFNERINGKFYSSLLRLPKMFFDSRKIGDFVARLNDTQRIQMVIKQLITNTTVDILGIFISIGFLFFYSWKLAVACIIVSPIIFYMIFRFNKKIIETQTNVMQAYSTNEANYIDSIRGIEVVKGFSKQDLFVKRNKTIFGFFQTKIFELGKLNLTISLYSGLSLVVFLLLILGISSYSVLSNELKIGELMAIIGISSSLLSSITNLALVTIPIQEAKVAFDRMFEYSSLEKEKVEGLEIKEIESIEIKNIDFRFNGRSRLLTQVSFSLQKGNITCLLGESGSGKTTLTEVLQKNYLPEKGDIIINKNTNLKDISLNNWRNLIGIAQQNIQLFNGNILDNITLDEHLNEQKLQELISLGFDKFINSLPQGFLTLVGEEGINLSGGQKQLLGWMRALYHNPQFLILDEPTSSLDKDNRKFIYQLIQKLKFEKIIFIITHQLEDIKDISDEVLFLENTQVFKLSNNFELVNI